MKAFIKKKCVKTVGFLMRLDRDSGNVKKILLAIKPEGKD